MDHRDIVEIQQLIGMYGHAVDHADQSLFPLVFTEDAQFDGRDAGQRLYVGRDEIAAWFALGKPPHPPAHLVTNVVVRQEGRHVTVWSKWFFVDPRDGTGCTGDYEDRVVRTPDGWRIQYRRVIPRYPKTFAPSEGPAQPAAAAE